MIEVKNLLGDELALWVASALKYEVRQQGGKWQVFVPSDDFWRSIAWYGWCPDRGWTYGGRLIEEHKILLWPVSQANYGNPIEQWTARCNATPKMQFYADSALVAAMRALVASVYGDTLPDEVAP